MKRVLNSLCIESLFFSNYPLWNGEKRLLSLFSRFFSFLVGLHKKPYISSWEFPKEWEEFTFPISFYHFQSKMKSIQILFILYISEKVYLFIFHTPVRFHFSFFIRNFIFNKKVRFWNTQDIKDYIAIFMGIPTEFRQVWNPGHILFIWYFVRENSFFYVKNNF